MFKAIIFVLLFSSSFVVAQTGEDETLLQLGEPAAYMQSIYKACSLQHAIKAQKAFQFVKFAFQERLRTDSSGDPAYSDFEIREFTTTYRSNIRNDLRVLKNQCEALK